MKISKCVAGVALTLFLGLSSAPASFADESVVSVGDVSWVSGGVGADSRERLQALASGFGFNLKLLFARQDGEYLSGVEFRVADPAGRVLLQAVSEGPILLVRVPPGRYIVSAKSDGVELRQTLSAVDGRLGTSVFRWPAE